MRIYAIGDIHGQRAMLAAAHARIEHDRKATSDYDAPVVHLGDLVDRGPDSRGVIDDLIAGRAKGKPWIVLKGNHDEMFATQIGVGGPPSVPFRAWAGQSLGGAATCHSYGVRARMLTGEAVARRRLEEAVQQDHRSFLEQLRLYYETSDLIFVHAGIRPGLRLSEQIEHDLIWIRGEFLDDPRDHGKLIVHGHTPIESATHYGNRVNLDTGAGYDRKLTVAVFEGRHVWLLDDTGRTPLVPV